MPVIILGESTKQNILVAVVNKEAVGITGVIPLLPDSSYVCKLMSMILTNALLSDLEITCDQLASSSHVWSFNSEYEDLVFNSDRNFCHKL